MCTCKNVSESPFVLFIVLIELAVTGANTVLAIFLGSPANADAGNTLLFDHSPQSLDIASLLDRLCSSILSVACLLQPPFVAVFFVCLAFLLPFFSWLRLSHSEVLTLAESLEHCELMKLRNRLFSKVLLLNKAQL